MLQIINYIKKGKGVGLLIVLAAAVLSTIILMLSGRYVYSQARPQIMLIAQDFLPITVKDGKVVNPVGTYKRNDLGFGKPGGVFPIVLDTREEISQLPTAKQGLFLMRDKIYTVSPTQKRIFTWEDGVWDTERFETVLDYFSGIVFGILAIIGAAVFFLMYLFKTWLVSVLGLIGVKVMKKDEIFDFSVLMRLSAVLVCVMEIISFALNTVLAFSIPGKMIFFLAVALEWLFIGREKADEA
ncbi:MAG: DUF1189 family protein [Alphaproteobacteria bacterium]|nr:DUF1189 family protein [Alphaproteobacteria bacterium]